MELPAPSAPAAAPDDAWSTVLTRALITAGASWCGAVLALAFFEGQSARWLSALAAAPALIALFVGLYAAPSRRTTRVQLGLMVASGLVLLGCAGLVLAGRAPLSKEGRTNRALAGLSVAALAWEVRRLARRARQQPPAPAPTPYLTVFSFGSFEDVLAERAAALGTPREALLERLAQAIEEAAAAHFGSKDRFEAAYEPSRQTFALKVVPVVTAARPWPGASPGDGAVIDVFWRLEDQAQAQVQDQAYADLLGFTSRAAGFEVVVDGLTREVFGLPKAGPLELLREDWLRLMNAGLQLLREDQIVHAVELQTESDALPRPLTGRTLFDVALEGPKLNDFRATPRALDTEVLVDGAPVHVGTQSWDTLTVSVLGEPDVAALEDWTRRWMAPAEQAPEGRLAGAVHQVKLLRYTTGVELTVDLGSAPVAALEELVCLLRPFGAVSLDDAALRALGDRLHEGTRDDVVPLLRGETGSLSEHLVGSLWLHFAVESKRVFSSLTPEELQGLGLTVGELRALALENLRRRIPPPEFTGHSGVYMLTLPGEGGHFEASLLLLDEVWQRAATLVKGPVVVGLPCRDLLFVTGAEDAEGLAKLRRFVADAQQKALEHPLTQQLFVRRDGAWRVFDAGH